jgi:hypothetical protein
VQTFSFEAVQQTKGFNDKMRFWFVITMIAISILCFSLAVYYPWLILANIVFLGVLLKVFYFTLRKTNMFRTYTVTLLPELIIIYEEQQEIFAELWVNIGHISLGRPAIKSGPRFLAFYNHGKKMRFSSKYTTKD